VAQVGRISGPLLEANLLRQGIANGTQQNLSFKNTNTDTTLLKVDVANGRIGVDLEAPANELHISQTTQTTDLIVDNCAYIANFTICGNDINVNSGNLYLNAAEAIVLSNLETEQFYVSDNYISTKDTNTDIELKPHGTGHVEIQGNLETFGDIHSVGNITLDGNITFGDSDQDSLDFNADLVDSLIPDITDTYDLGSQQKRWNQLNVVDVYGQLINTGQINVDGMSLESRQGNIFYVAKGGDDSNVGDHPNGPLLTIQEAIARCDASTSGPVTIYIYPGEYEEACPLVIPDNVSIVGIDIRNVVVKPTVATQSEDVFHLSDSSTVSNITIKDYFYDSGNNTGYAFRFAPGAVITNRSPYIQNVTVITAGSVTSASDPRGFDEGDAGRGAWIDGAELDSASIEASMLFHSATFITPGVDAISMTNGVRVEWLNSFTYFANRGLYAFNGLTGRTTYDGSTVEYGAELRSIGSANVYGNYGAVADGADTLMYLIQHNMAYVGAGKFVDNDASRAVYANETVELNSGVIHYTTTDHLGGFRIGDNFWVDFETGNTTVNIDTLTVNQFNALRVNTGNDTTVIDGAYIETGNLRIEDNLISSVSGDLNLASATGTINLQDNTNVTGNVAISGDLSYDGVLNISGDEPTDSLTFNTEFEQDFNPNLHQTYDLGSFQKKWLLVHLNRIEAGDMSFYDNVIETNVSNADLELRANGTGRVYIPNNNVTFSNSLTVNGTTTVNNGIDITDPTLTITGDITQTGSTSTSEDFDVGENLNVGASAQFEEILVDDNYITTTTSNADLELRAAGTGIVNLQTNVNVDNNLSANDIDATNVTVTLNTTSDNANIGDIEINDNYIETTNLNSNLVLGADRAVFVKGTDTTFGQNLTVSGQTNLNGNVTVTGTITHVGDTSQTGNVTLNGEWTNDNIYIEDNYISTVQSNSDLELRASGTGEILIPNNNLQINNNLTVSTNTNLQDTTITGSLIHVGDIANTGNYTLNGELTVDNVYIEDNFITTTLGNLTLEAAGTGTINVDSNDVEIAQDLNVGGATSLQDTTITGTVTHAGNRTQTGNLDIAGEISNGNILIEDNFITTTNSNSDLELRASGTGEVVIDTDDTVTINNNLFVGGTLTYQGTLTINGDVVLLGNVQDGSLTVTENFDITGKLSVGAAAQFEEILIDDNFITTTSSDANLELRASGTGDIFVPNNDVQVNNNLFAASINAVDITVNNDLTLDELVITDSNIEINENYITTKISNADLELRATGDVVVQENTIIEQDLTVNGTTNLQDTNITGTLTHTGNRTQNGDYTIIGDFNFESLVSDRNFQFDDIKISGNVLETTLSNSNLDLRAAGTGEIFFNDPVNISNDLSVGSLNVGHIFVDNDVSFEEIELSTDVQFEDNYITTTNSNSNLELRAAGNGGVFFDNIEAKNNTLQTIGDSSYNEDIVFAPAENLSITSNSALTIPVGTTEDRLNLLGDIRFNTDGNLFEGFGTTSITLNGVYSADRLTSLTADQTSNNIRMIINGAVDPLDSTSLVGEVTGEGLFIHAVQVEEININNNLIQTTNSNADLELRANGTGELVVDDISLYQNNIKDNGNNLIIKNTGFGHTKFNGTFGIVVPSGGTVTPSPAPQVGDTRWNTSDGQLETWDGTKYVVATGSQTAISQSDFDDLLLEYTIIFG
jgi:cytoskeletal protein CcmA (bactofilin family)